ncbi:hypothetical protein ACFC60_26275 [Kitasatospora purpeofusca]|uniref:hypothetical protein n=1 Tax=Kitasatospora purpeofusca TaxID=67352 RepID=UPI0035E21883
MSPKPQVNERTGSREHQSPSPGAPGRSPPTNKESPTSTHHTDFHPVVATATTEHHASRPILASTRLRIVRADQLRTGDLIVSGFDRAQPGRLPRSGFYATGPYRARPDTYDPACGYGVCGLPEVHGPDGTIVLTTGRPWNTYDPWPADDLVLIQPRRTLAAAPPTERTR